MNDHRPNLARLGYNDLVRAARALIDISTNYGILEKLNLTEGDELDYHELLSALEKEMRLRRQVAAVLRSGNDGEDKIGADF